MGALRVGLRIPQYGTTWPRLRDDALRAERLGFDGLWLNDHLQSPGRLKSEPTFDALTTLAALAPLTHRARLGVAVMSASYRPPGLAAKVTSVLDVISSGRMVIGLGTGSDRAEHAAFGIPMGTSGHRTRLVRQALRTIRAMGEAPDGATVPGVLAGAPNRPAPVQRPHPPVWLAAHGPRLLTLAGREADGVVGAFLRPDALGRRRAVAEEAREAAGRPALAHALYTYALPMPSTAEAEAWLAPEAEALGTSARRLVRWLRSTGIVGPPEAMRDELRAFADAGATDAVLVLPSRVPPDAIEALAETVLPAPTPTGRAPGGAGRAAANIAHRLVESRREEGRGGDLAAVDPAGTWTFDALGEAAARAAGALREAGARRGERVALPLHDGRPWLAAFLGVVRLGAVAAPLDPDGDPARLAEVLADLEPALVVAEEETTAGPWPWLAPGALAEGPPAPLAPVHGEDLAYLIHSSGSTGRPKGTMHAHRDLEVTIAGYGREVLGLGPGDRCHSVAKLFTSLGFGNGFFRPLGLGAAVVLWPGRPTARSVTRLVREHGVTVLTGVPTLWAQLAAFGERHPREVDADDPEAGRLLGDALPPAVGERVRAMLGVDLLEGLGCSECSAIVLSTRPGEPLPGTLGRVVPGVEVRLADEEGRPVAAGAPGRLWILSDSNTTGYWRRAAETREAVYGPWVRMGDVLVERDGVYRHLGRADDLFKVDARWVSPVAVEAALTEHPAVREAAVVGRPDDRGLLRPVAFVVADAGTGDGPGLADQLRRHVAHRLEPHAAPAVVRFVEALPRLPSGKLDRRGLPG